jgi:hypothetical protein
MRYETIFGSLGSYTKGRVEPIDDDPRRYAFSNLFDVASRARPYEKVAVAKNIEYVLEAIRAEGTSEWRAATHDEFALIMDGEVEVRLVKLADPQAIIGGTRGSIGLGDDPQGERMGRVVARRGHMVLLPAWCAYQFHADGPAVILQQTILGRDTVQRWAEICQTSI